MIKLEDYQGKTLKLACNKLVESKSPGYSYFSGIYQGVFTLYRGFANGPTRAVITVDLPSSHSHDEVVSVRHILTDDDLEGIFTQLDELDFMQHVRLPHWVGSCALLDTDMGARLKIRADLNRGATDFMDKCLRFGNWLDNFRVYTRSRSPKPTEDPSPQSPDL